MKVFFFLFSYEITNKQQHKTENEQTNKPHAYPALHTTNQYKSIGSRLENTARVPYPGPHPASLNKKQRER